MHLAVQVCVAFGKDAHWKPGNALEHWASPLSRTILVLSLARQDALPQSCLVYRSPAVQHKTGHPTPPIPYSIQLLRAYCIIWDSLGA